MRHKAHAALFLQRKNKVRESLGIALRPTGEVEEA